MKFSAAHAPAWHRPALAHRRAWLRLLLLAMLWSSVQGLLGWWVVQGTAQPGQAVVEVCTPNGMQWVALDGAVGETPATPVDGPATLGQPCVWAAAALSLPAAPLPQGLVAVWAPARLHRVGRCRAPTPQDTVARVLLMAPMRAPPLA